MKKVVVSFGVLELDGPGNEPILSVGITADVTVSFDRETLEWVAEADNAVGRSDNHLTALLGWLKKRLALRGSL